MTAERIFGRGVLVLWIAAVYVFLFAPLVVIVGASFSGGSDGASAANPIARLYVNFPPERLSLYWYERIPVEDRKSVV